jgi:hypothetical protein
VISFEATAGRKRSDAGDVVGARYRRELVLLDPVVAEIGVPLNLNPAVGREKHAKSVA